MEKTKKHLTRLPSKETMKKLNNKQKETPIIYIWTTKEDKEQAIKLVDRTRKEVIEELRNEILIDLKKLNDKNDNSINYKTVDWLINRIFYLKLKERKQ